ncbi:MAG TPA: FAD-dependent oxidoreductase [Streptosporangiaceae bacterium]|nr:FAD-dependent oxidoreductase [Streptosporangiaceae bacterium]
MPGQPAYVIVGASLAGAKAAQTLREEGFGGAVVLIGTEDERPYERPPLSKGYLLGKDSRDSIFVHAEDWYAAHDVDLRRGVTATSIDRFDKRVGLRGGDFVPYDRLLITTGASPRGLNVPGAGLDGTFYLRTVGDSERLGAALRGGGSVVIAGAGWIGLETAAAAREYGCEATVVEPESVALQRSLGPELGGVFADLHRSHGVTFRFGEGLSEVTGSGGKVTGAVTSSGQELPADIVIVAIGAAANSAIAAEAGLEVDNGIVVDETLRTSDPDIFAAGDVANAFNPLVGRRIRVEHWANALNSGPAAARSMLGQQVSYDRVPYFYSDQYDLGMETAGLPEPGTYDEIVYRGDKESLEFIAFWLEDGAVVAGMNVNVWDVNDDIQALIRSETLIDPDRLADPDIPLTDL